MNYELAKRLKDAEFPQNKPWETEAPDWVCQHPAGGHEVTKECDKCYTPTLSELIEACGRGFSSLLNRYSKWEAYGQGDVQVWREGDTPEEAVANLWLALNKQNG